MLIQNDPFRDFDALFGRLGRSSNGSVAMPMDAFRRGSDVWVQIDLPGVAADSLDITVERSVLTVSAERTWQREEGDQVYLAERHRGTYRRQVHLGEGLDAERIEADFTDGVLRCVSPSPSRPSRARSKSAPDEQRSTSSRSPPAEATAQPVAPCGVTARSVSRPRTGQARPLRRIPSTPCPMGATCRGRDTLLETTNATRRLSRNHARTRG